MNCIKNVECNDPIKRSWFSLGASLVVAALAGTPYAYGAFSPAIKRILNYGQSEITLLTSIGLLGMFSGVLTGTFYDHMGARPTLLIGSMLSALCYYIMYLQFSLQISSTTTSVQVAYFFANVGNSFRIASATAVCIKNFPSSQRGKLVGLAKGYFAVGASMYSQLYLALFSGQVDKFFLFLTIETFIFMILCYPYFIDVPVDSVIITTTNENTPNQEENEIEKIQNENSIIKQLNLWYILTFSFASFLTVFSVFQQLYRRGSWNPTVFLIGIVLLTGCMIWLANYKAKIDESRFSPEVTSAKFILATTPNKPKPDEQKITATEQVFNDIESNPVQTQRKDLPLTKAALKITFWLLFLIFFMICGCALVVYNNVAQIKFSLVKMHNAHLEVTILGVGSLLGRTGIGYLSDTYRQVIPREGFLILCSLIMAIAMGIFCLGIGSLIVPASFFTSLSYGGMFCLIPSLTADYYGSKYYAGNYGALDLAPAIGSFFYASYIVQIFYKDSNVAGIRNCVGQSCFRGTFLICLFSSIGGILLSIVLYRMMARKRN